jgi:2-methylcitrate dehydratase PrpD
VRDLAQRIELEPVHDTRTHAPGLWPSEVTLECAGQRHTLTTRGYKGSPHDPFTWPEAGEKFRRYTASILPVERATAIIEAVGRLERVADMAEVARLLAAG